MMKAQSLRGLLAASVVLLVSACGSSNDSASDVPSLNGSSGKSGSTTSTTVDQEKAVQQFVSCLRKQGLTVADPKVDSNGRIDMRSIFQSANIQPGSTEFEKARTECGKYLQNAGFGPSDAERKQRQEAMLEFTSCLRSQGLTVADMTFDGPGGFGGPPPGAAASASATAAGSSATTAGGSSAASTTAATQGVPDRGGPPANEAERTARLAERLGLDANDATVTAAFKACNSKLAALAPGGGTTTTTQA